MYRVIVFAGTTEGYELCRFLRKHCVETLACVATEYGSRSIGENEYLHVRSGRLSCEAMTELFLEERPQLVLDATHPYAAEVTENIRSACESSGVTRIRVLRDSGDCAGDAVCVSDTAEAAEYLKRTKGSVLLTTGSKELSAFTCIPDYENRLYARVLSLPSVLEECRKYGFEGKHLIGMQGPFSTELNIAMLRQFSCRYLVTKNTGKAGGFEEKLEAAHACGVVPVIIGRPVCENGVSVSECRKMLMDLFSLTRMQQVTLLGIGMGSRGTMTAAGQEALLQAELLIGARRMTDAVRMAHHTVVNEYAGEKIASYIEEHPQYERIVVALSGDVGFFSGAKKLLKLLPHDTQLICGISSVAYFMAKIGLSWDDAKIVSAHGREANLISDIRYNEKTFAILGTETAVAKLACKLTQYGMQDVLLYVGEDLSYESERIFAKPAAELTDYRGSSLSVVCAYNPKAIAYPATHGVPDEEFLRGKAPMTKEEVRAVSLAKLRLTEDSVCCDVGAGTGSVAVEMALRAAKGKVFAVEKKEDALALLKENKKKFAVPNMEIIAGTAPEALYELPPCTHAFVGGSSGKLGEIIEALTDKNQNIRIVINCITLETLSEALAAIKRFAFTKTQIVQLGVSRAKTAGPYHMMMGENPIYIITCQKEEI